MLTVKELESLARHDGRHSIGDGSGLALLVRDDGKRRVWTQRLAIRGKRREVGHGSYPEVSLARARAAAKVICDQVSAGADPLAEKGEARAADKAATTQTLDAALTAYIEAHGAAWRSAKTRKQTRESLERHAPRLLLKSVRDITTEHVRGVLAPIWTTKPVTAQKVRARLEGALEWAIAARWRSGPNPAMWRGNLRPLLARPSSVKRNRHHPALGWDRLPEFLVELRGEHGTAPRALELVVLTACRSGEVRGATWREVSLESALWIIPGARMKAGNEHRVPLCGPALALLRRMLPDDGSAPDPAGLIFPNSKGLALSDMSLLAVLKRMDARRAGGWRDEHGNRIVPHGFRSSFRDWCGDTERPRDLAEAALAHSLGSRTERSYARSDLLARRARLMDAWAAHCEGYVTKEVPAPRMRSVSAA